MITPMLRPDLFGALATHAGDALYEYCYIPEFPVVVRHLRKYDGDILRWWDDFRSRVSFTQPEDMPLVALLGVAACFSAADDGTPELPFDPVTGVLRPDVWQRWLDWDPVRMVPRYAAALRGLPWHLDRRRDQGRFLPRRRRGGLPGGAARRGSLGRADPLRAVRRHPRRHRLPVPALARVAVPANGRLTAPPEAQQLGQLSISSDHFFAYLSVLTAFVSELSEFCGQNR